MRQGRPLGSFGIQGCEMSVLTATHRPVFAIAVCVIAATIVGWPKPVALAAALPEGGVQADSAVRVHTLAPQTAVLASTVDRGSLRELARRDPLGLVELGLRRYQERVRDYRCVFHKQERIDGKLGAQEEIEVRFRVEPTSVFMVWRRNADQVRRVLFIDDGRSLDSKGRKQARVEPNGAIARLFVRDIMLPINGKRAESASRRTIDEFGFGQTFRLFDRFNRVAAQRGELVVRYDGEGEIDGRPTFRLVRLLPYTGQGGMYPEARLEFHLDQETLLPTAVFAWGKADGAYLLGSYVFTDVQLNCGLSDADFRF